VDRQNSDLPVSWQQREAGENFPVALRILPRADREHLHAVYDYARMVDELGDSYEGDRVAVLERVREETSGIWRGHVPDAPILAVLAATVADCALSEQPFLDLIEANLQDQRVTRYATFEELVGYCRLSADPVGRIVLELFAQSTPERVALSDRVCTALQIVEHLQDVGEDHAAGRVYLPQESLAEHGVTEDELAADTASAGLRALILAETDRAEAMLHEGRPLVGQLRGWARVAVAGFVAGGQATVDALRASGGDVLGQTVKPGKLATVRHASGLLLGRRAA